LDRVEEKIVMKDAAIGDTEDHYEVFLVGREARRLFSLYWSIQGETNQAEISRDETYREENT
jgi:hypothetical protein